MAALRIGGSANTLVGLLGADLVAVPRPAPPTCTCAIGFSAPGSPHICAARCGEPQPVPSVCPIASVLQRQISVHYREPGNTHLPPRGKAACDSGSIEMKADMPSRRNCKSFLDKCVEASIELLEASSFGTAQVEGSGADSNLEHQMLLQCFRQVMRKAEAQVTTRVPAERQGPIFHDRSKKVSVVWQS